MFFRKGNFKIIITKHAIQRADKRKIWIDLIENTIQCGEMAWFGKRNVKFVKKFKKFEIICVDEKTGNLIRIATIEKKRK